MEILPRSPSWALGISVLEFVAPAESAADGRGSQPASAAVSAVLPVLRRLAPSAPSAPCRAGLPRARPVGPVGAISAGVAILTGWARVTI